jgi:hypothetical protein
VGTNIQDKDIFMNKRNSDYNALRMANNGKATLISEKV